MCCLRCEAPIWNSAWVWWWRTLFPILLYMCACAQTTPQFSCCIMYTCTYTYIFYTYMLFKIIYEPCERDTQGCFYIKYMRCGVLNFIANLFGYRLFKKKLSAECSFKEYSILLCKHKNSIFYEFYLFYYHNLRRYCNFIWLNLVKFNF